MGQDFWVWFDSWSLVKRRSLMVLVVAFAGENECLVKGGLVSMVILVGCMCNAFWGIAPATIIYQKTKNKNKKIRKF